MFNARLDDLLGGREFNGDFAFPVVPFPAGMLQEDETMNRPRPGNHFQEAGDRLVRLLEIGFDKYPKGVPREARRPGAAEHADIAALGDQGLRQSASGPPGAADENVMRSDQSLRLPPAP